MTDATRRVPGYGDEVQKRKEFVLRAFEYEMPFNYPNIQVNRFQYIGGESHGVELNPANSLCDRDEHLPGDSIVIQEEDPIVRVEVIGSACNPPGFILLEAEPTEDFRRAGEVVEVMPVRFRIDNLWGMHLRVDQWVRRAGGGFTAHTHPELYPDPLPERMASRNLAAKAISREFPMTGMSCAVFAIPRSKKVTIVGGCTVPGFPSDNYPDDVQYSFRLIRVTVAQEQ